MVIFTNIYIYIYIYTLNSPFHSTSLSLSPSDPLPLIRPLLLSLLCSPPELQGPAEQAAVGVSTGAASLFPSTFDFAPPFLPLELVAQASFQRPSARRRRHLPLCHGFHFCLSSSQPNPTSLPQNLISFLVCFLSFPPTTIDGGVR